MSEFTDVMEQAKRMCKAFSDGHCSECPVGDANALECGITVTSEMDCKDVERRVMQWAAKHPEQVYPSWNEWYRQNFTDAYCDGKRMCPMIFGGGENCDSETDCDKCRDTPIPADIAEKLGIKPKEAK